MGRALWFIRDAWSCQVEVHCARALQGGAHPVQGRWWWLQADMQWSCTHKGAAGGLKTVKTGPHRKHNPKMQPESACTRADALQPVQLQKRKPLSMLRFLVAHSCAACNCCPALPCCASFQRSTALAVRVTVCICVLRFTASTLVRCRRADSKLNASQEKVLKDMVEDGHAGPQNIDKRFKRDASGQRKANRPTQAQIASFKHNMKRPPKNAPPTPPGSGQAPTSPGSPVAELDTVCSLYNFAASIKLPHLVSDMNREAMCSATSRTTQLMHL